MMNRFRTAIITICFVCFALYNVSGSTPATYSDPGKQVTIAIAQILCIDGDLSGNLVRIENAIIEAMGKNADIIVFAESCLLGWINPDAFKRACPIPGHDSETICRLARKYEVYICIGLDEKEGDKLYDSAILVDNTGKILLKHRKINVLPELMDPPYSVGVDVGVADTKFGKIGVMICADSFLENVLDRMKTKKPDLLLIPYGWAAPEKDWPEHGQELLNVLKNAAVKVGCPVIGTDLIGQVSHGPWTGMVYGGQSAGFDPGSGTLVVGRDRERDIAIIKLQLNK